MASGAPQQWHYTRIGEDADGVSYFSDHTIELGDGGPIGSLSEKWPVVSVQFRTNSPDYVYDWHPAPARQFIVMLAGILEVETGSGEVRRFPPGEVVLVEDVLGRGHRSRAVGGEARRSLFLVLAE